jgi:hypothetical protein
MSKYTIKISRLIAEEAGLKQWMKFETYLKTLSDKSTSMFRHSFAGDESFLTVRTDDEIVAVNVTVFARGGYSEWVKLQEMVLDNYLRR